MLIALALTSCDSGSRVVINEFMAANASGLTDQDGDTSDWIELFNPDPVAANLSGWCLTDDPHKPARWCFGEVSIPAQGYLLVFASGKQLPGARHELHASFRLEAAADFLALLRARGRVASELSYPDQKRDVSFGRTSSGAMTFLERPTPGGPNSEARTGEN